MLKIRRKKNTTIRIPKKEGLKREITCAENAQITLIIANGNKQKTKTGAKERAS